MGLLEKIPNDIGEGRERLPGLFLKILLGNVVLCSKYSSQNHM